MRAATDLPRTAIPGWIYLVRSKIERSDPVNLPPVPGTHRFGTIRTEFKPALTNPVITFTFEPLPQQFEITKKGYYWLIYTDEYLTPLFWQEASQGFLYKGHTINLY